MIALAESKTPELAKIPLAGLPSHRQGGDFYKQFFELGGDLDFKMWEQMWERSRS